MLPLSRDQDHELDLEAGDKLELEDIPATGFSWELGELPPGWSVAEDEWSSGLLDDGDEFEGAAGIRVLRFAAAAGALPGSLLIERRQTGEPASTTATVRLNLKP